MKFTSQLAHVVPKHASKECSLTGRSQKTPGTDSKLIRTFTNHPAGVKTAVLHLRMCHSKFTSLIQFIKSCKKH